MATATLPNSLQSKLKDLSARLQRLRLLRGLSWVVLALVGGAALIVALDYWLELPSVVRMLLVAGWLGGSGVTFWRGLVRPLRWPLTPDILAAAVEEEYPVIKERLSSSVELSENNDDYHGSRAFVHLLLRETDLKTRALDFLRAAPSQKAEWSAAGAVGALLLLAAPAVLWPEAALGLGRRLVMPWDHRPAFLPFDIVVTPGDAFAAKGRPLTLAVELTPKQTGVVLPTACTLVLAPADGKPLRLRMAPGTKSNTFAFRIDELKCDYRYHVEIGTDESARHSITAIEPVELADGQPITTLTPPAYAKAPTSQKIEGLADLTILQFGRVALECRFTRPADSATLIWTTAENGAKPEHIPLQLSADRLSARAELAARESGMLRLELDAGHGVITAPPAQALAVTLDRPPEFRRVTGLPEQADAKLTDSLPLTLAVADDLGVATVEVEYRINNGPVQHEAVPLVGLGTPQASGPFTFKLADKVKDGDTLRIRFHASDTRDVPEANLGPNVVYHPPGDRWAELHVVRAAESLRQQEVTAKRDEFEKRLRDIIDQLSQNQRKLYRLYQEINQRQADPKAQAESLQQLTADHDAQMAKLTDLARDSATAGFAPLADKAKAVSDEELRQAAEALRDAGAQTGQARVPPLRRAESATIQARDKLEALLQENRELARAKLDEVKLQDLAERERELAEKVDKATTAEEREKLVEQQKALAEELRKLTQNNEALREAIRAAQAEQARKLAEKSTELAKTERAIDEKLRETERLRNVEKLADLAKKQQQLADEAAQLAKTTKTPTEAAHVPSLNPDDAAKAADSLRRGEADDALKQQERAASDLDKLAENLQRALDLSRDPREAAAQLGRFQAETLRRLRANSNNRDAFQRDEELIRRAIGQLPVPRDNVSAQREQSAAAEKAGQAAAKLQQGDSKTAQERMTEVGDALNRLYRSLPDADQRLRQAREDVARLRKQQDEVGQQADKAARSAERGDPAARQRAADEQAEAARKQAEVAERLSRLDAPGQEQRRERAKQASDRALDDLLNHRTADVAASQGDARRALERMQEALAGQTPADDKARELAKQESQLANDAAQTGDDPNRQSDLQRRQERIAREAQDLKATEAPGRQAEAVQAAIQANKVLRERPNDPDIGDRLKDAAAKLQQLADQLAGEETNIERADRLAKQQEAAAQNPQANPIESRRQTNQIAEEAKQVRADEKAAAEKQQVLDAMSRLQRMPPDAPGHAEAKEAAAQALRKLADKLADANAENARNEAQPLPSAQDLAQQQRDITRQTEAAQRQSGADKQQALNRATADQKKLQEQAARLPPGQAPQAVQQARQAMDRAAQALDRNDATKAAQQQKQAAEALEQASRQSEQAASDAARKSGQQQPNGLPNAEQVGQARELAKEQRDLREQVRQAVGRFGEERTADESSAQAQKQQQQVAQQSGELAKSLQQSAGQMSNEMAKDAAQDAARAAQRAKDALNPGQDGQSTPSQSARRDAIDALDKAANKAEQAARAADPGTRRASPNGQPPPSDTGQTVQDAQGQMNQAQGQLSQGQNLAAQGSMQQAAQALDQAARQIGQRSQGEGQRDSDQRSESATRPATSAEPGRGEPNSSELPPDLKKYAGKKWGELPGELRTRILQEMKAQYGDDYARIIKLYFEQIADNKPPK